MAGIVVAGALAQKPGRGGHTWVFLQYLLGFRRLGWDVLFLDQLAPGESADDTGTRYFLDTMERIGAGKSSALVCDGGRTVGGLSRAEAIARVKDAALLLNINGFLADDQILGAAPRRVFLDIDPGVCHMWHALGLKDVFRGHDDYVTIGENVGHSGCIVPTCGIDWIATRPPVVLAEWPVCATADRGSFTSIATWRGAYGPIEYCGTTYGLRVHEFRHFAEVPRWSGGAFEVALDIHPSDAKDAALLRANGWSLVDPMVAAGDPWAYRHYIQASAAEFMVAKSMYAQTRCGWFSDRSVCYLASGKPVVMQDTGVSAIYPTGEGLLTFTTPDEAIAAVREVAGAYEPHRRAARAIAEEYFDSDTVLRRLLRNLRVA